jgi:hypothetical protein
MKWKRCYLSLSLSSVFAVIVALALAGRMWYCLRHMLVGNQRALRC